MQGLVLGKVAKMFTEPLVKGGHTPAYLDPLRQYLRISLSMPTAIDTVQLLVQKAPNLGRHSMLATDRFNNPATLGIPIAMCFGDQDMLQSEGACETLIKRSVRN